jgi:nucleoid DNA-binding protein
MRKAKWAGAAILITVTGFALAQSGQPQPQPQPPPKPERITQFGQGPRTAIPNSLRGRIVAATKLPEDEVGKVLDALAPAIRGLLGQGETVTVPNLGTFRVVRIPDHRDMVDGRPVTVTGSNYIEFLATGAFASAANQPGVQPAETVPPFEYKTLPDQTQGLKTGGTRSPSSRTP